MLGHESPTFFGSDGGCSLALALPPMGNPHIATGPDPLLAARMAAAVNPLFSFQHGNAILQSNRRQFMCGSKADLLGGHFGGESLMSNPTSAGFHHVFSNRSGDSPSSFLALASAVRRLTSNGASPPPMGRPICPSGRPSPPSMGRQMCQSGRSAMLLLQDYPTEDADVRKSSIDALRLKAREHLNQFQEKPEARSTSSRCSSSQSPKINMTS